MYKVSIHKNFKLNGNSFINKDELLDYAEKEFTGIGQFLTEWFNDESFITAMSSGSTGVPKKIKLQKERMIYSAINTGTYFELPEKTSALLCMSPNFIAGKMMLVRALTLGWHLDVVAPTSQPLKDRNNRYDFAAMVPLQLYKSLDELNKIKKLIVGGGAISKNIILRIQEVSTKIFATYGMTETITHIAAKKLNHFENPESEALNCYTTLPNIHISLDQRHCLVIDAPQLSEKPIVTNDITILLSDTTFRWMGRFDNVINSGGIKIIPEHVESQLEKVISNRLFVGGISDPVLGEKLILIVEDAELIYSKEQIFAEIQRLDTLSKFEMPKEIYFLEKFIETENGKINRIRTLNLL